MIVVPPDPKLLEIKSDGTPQGTAVTLDGKTINGITAIEWTMTGPDRIAEATIRFYPSKVELCVPINLPTCPRCGGRVLVADSTPGYASCPNCFISGIPVVVSGPQG